MIFFPDAIKCHVCGNKFLSKNALKCHMRCHTGAKPYECPYCAKRFRTSGNRKAHIYAEHPTIPENNDPANNELAISQIR